MSTRLFVEECFDGKHKDCKGYNGPADNPNFRCDCDCHKQPAEDERVREVISFAAFWRGLYAHHINVEEGDYLRCLRCNGESAYHGRELDPKDVTHAERCPVAVAQELAKGSLLPVQPAASTEAQDERGAVICPVCKSEVPEDSMLSYNNIPNAFCQQCVDSGRV